MMSPKRYIGLDVHKQQVTVAAVDSQQQVVLAPGEIAIQHFSAWAKANLKPTDEVALEATSNAWELYDQLEPLVENVTVANAHKVKLISSGRTKTICSLGRYVSAAGDGQLGVTSRTFRPA